MSNWDQFQNQDEAHVRSEILRLAAVHNRRMKDEAVSHWVQRLLPFAGPHLDRAIDAACDTTVFPSLASVLERAQAEKRRNQKYEPPPKLTELEQHKADVAAVKSLLWLHYAKGWTLAEIGGDTLGKIYARQRGISDADEMAVLVAAQEAYPKETILRWMDDTARL